VPGGLSASLFLGWDGPGAMNLYLWTKILHLWCVVGWMATVLVLPPLLQAIAAAEADAATRARFLVLGRRAYRIGHHLLGWAVLCGLVLWLKVGIGGGWLHAKLAVVAALLAHFMASGRWVKRAERGDPLPTERLLRWHGRWPMLLLAVVVWLVLAKPF
jgi:putative membrane protein